MSDMWSGFGAKWGNYLRFERRIIANSGDTILANTLQMCHLRIFHARKYKAHVETSDFVFVELLNVP